MAVRPWLPSDSAGVTVFEFDPGNSASVTQAAGTVSSITSKNGSLAATQSTASAQPTYDATAFNGFPALVYTGSQILLTPAFAQGPNWSVFSAFTTANTSTTQYLFDADQRSNASGNQRIANYIRIAGGNLLSSTFASNQTSIYNASTALSANTPGIIGATLPNNVVSLSIDGGTATTSPTAPSNATGSMPLAIGGSANAVSGLFRGALGYVALVQGVLSSADYDRFVGYLAWRFNLQGNLPASHPYKSAAPTVTTADATTYTGTIALGANPAQAMAGLLAGASAAALGFAQGVNSISRALYAAQAPLAASAALAGAPSVTARVAAAFAEVSGLSGAAAARAATSLAVAALAAQTASSGLTAGAALALAESAGLTGTSAITAAEAAALALALAQASGTGGAATAASLTIGASALAAVAAQSTAASAAPLAASLGQAGTAAARYTPAVTVAQAGGTVVTAQAVAGAAASLIEAFGAGASAGGTQAFSEAVALAVSALHAANGRGVQASPLPLAVRPGSQVAGALGANAAATIAAGTTFQATTRVQAYGGLVVTGTLTLPVAPTLAGQSTASAAPTFAFTARLDPAAAATVSGSAAAVLAAQAAMAAILRESDPFANAQQLRGARSLTVTLQGQRMGTRTLAGTMRLTIAPQSSTRH